MKKLFYKNGNKIASVDIVPSDATVLFGWYKYEPLEDFVNKQKEFRVINSPVDIQMIRKF